jgi:hypothetical protein
MMLEAEIRDALHELAGESRPSRPNPDDVARRAARQQHRSRVARVAGGVALTAVVLVAAAAARSTSPSSVQTGATGDGPATTAAPSLGPVAMIALPGWRLTYVAVIPGDGGALPYVEHQLTRDGATLQVSFYETGTRVGNETNPTEVTVRGARGVTTDEGAPRYRVDWDEQGRTWEADGSPFTSIEDMIATLEQIQIVDATSWSAELPSGAADQILANPDRAVTWHEGDLVTCFDPRSTAPDADVACNPAP